MIRTLHEKKRISKGYAFTFVGEEDFLDNFRRAYMAALKWPDEIGQ